MIATAEQVGSIMKSGCLNTNVVCVTLPCGVRDAVTCGLGQTIFQCIHEDCRVLGYSRDHTVGL